MIDSSGDDTEDIWSPAPEVVPDGHIARPTPAVIDCRNLDRTQMMDIRRARINLRDASRDMSWKEGLPPFSSIDHEMDHLCWSFGRAWKKYRPGLSTTADLLALLDGDTDGKRVHVEKTVVVIKQEVKVRDKEKVEAKRERIRARRRTRRHKIAAQKRLERRVKE